MNWARGALGAAALAAMLAAGCCCGGKSCWLCGKGDKCRAEKKPEKRLIKEGEIPRGHNTIRDPQEAVRDFGVTSVDTEHPPVDFDTPVPAGIESKTLK